MVLPFPMMADYALLPTQAGTLFLTHGHIYNKESLPLLKAGDILFNGHFHTPERTVMANGAIYANCGSSALPKDGTPHSYIVYENGKLTWKNLQSGEEFSV